MRDRPGRPVRQREGQNGGGKTPGFGRGNGQFLVCTSSTPVRERGADSSTRLLRPPRNWPAWRPVAQAGRPAPAAVRQVRRLLVRAARPGGAGGRRAPVGAPECVEERMVGEAFRRTSCKTQPALGFVDNRSEDGSGSGNPGGRRQKGAAEAATTRSYARLLQIDAAQTAAQKVRKRESWREIIYTPKDAVMNIVVPAMANQENVSNSEAVKVRMRYFST